MKVTIRKIPNRGGVDAHIIVARLVQSVGEVIVIVFVTAAQNLDRSEVNNMDRGLP